MEWYVSALMVLGGLLFTISIGLPIAFSLGLVGGVGILLFVGPSALQVGGIVAWSTSSNFLLVSLPLFVLMAQVLMFSGLSNSLFAATQAWLGRLPGSLAISTAVACGGFAAVTGSSAANAATVGSVALPEMIKRGYDKALSTGVVVAGGTLGILIPPSGIMILYCGLTGTSIAKVFIAGIIPGVMLIVGMSIYILVRAMINPRIAPPAPVIGWKDKFRSLREVWALLLVILAVVVSIYAGIATPTESAGLGAFAALLISLHYRRLSWSVFKPSLMSTVRTSCFVFFLIIGSGIFGFLLNVLRIPQQLAAAVIEAGISPLVMIAVFSAVLLVLGCFMDPASIISLTMPIMFPIVQALHFNPIWFGIVTTLNMEIGCMAPPIGINLYIVKGIAQDVPMSSVLKGSLPFMLILVLGLVLVIAIPDIALWLPSQMQ